MSSHTFSTEGGEFMMVEVPENSRDFRIETGNYNVFMQQVLPSKLLVIKIEK